jgi:hypothetical protein
VLSVPITQGDIKSSVPPAGFGVSDTAGLRPPGVGGMEEMQEWVTGQVHLTANEGRASHDSFLPLMGILFSDTFRKVIGKNHGNSHHYCR